MNRRTVPTPEAMDALGAQLAQGLRALAASARAAEESFSPNGEAGGGCVVYLHGDLGAGKTTLVRGALHALGHDGRVKSPTYTLTESYPVPEAARELHHLDLYRLTSPEEVNGLALRDLPSTDWVLIEWPEKGGEALLPADLVAYLEHAGTGRVVSFDPLTPAGRVVVEAGGL